MIVAKVRIGGVSAEQAAASSGVHRSTVYRLLARHERGGWGALTERRPVPHRQPQRTSDELEKRILAARAASRYGPRRLGAILGLPASTVAKVLQRHGASRLRAPPDPRPFATSASARASCCTSTPSAWGAFTRWGSGSSPTGSSAARGLAGTTSTWP